MRKLRGFTLIELLIVVAIIAILAAIAVPNFLEAQVRSKVSRTRGDMRSLANALEAYYVDFNLYPPWGTSQFPVIANTFTYNQAIAIQAGRPNTGYALLPNFKMRGRTPATMFSSITTPVAYINSLPSDAFANRRGNTFCFFSVNPSDAAAVRQFATIASGRPRGGVGWILWSGGPDVDEFKTGNTDSPFRVYNPITSQPSTFEQGPPRGIGPMVGGIIAGRNPGSNNECFTYDPTNGTVSPGDVWRLKE
ncbi:prepilin-type N-terminal cleavage/methylation domain-containing protein [Candidatus Sumerlaeota bacterium]|nr:prepilin-type N-terminal cleavage/methylation domain-containing protein [Candidatus Sumerlaeota bacterium]